MDKNYLEMIKKTAEKYLNELEAHINRLKSGKIRQELELLKGQVKRDVLRLEDVIEKQSTKGILLAVSGLRQTLGKIHSKKTPDGLNQHHSKLQGLLDRYEQHKIEKRSFRSEQGPSGTTHRKYMYPVIVVVIIIAAFVLYSSLPAPITGAFFKVGGVITDVDGNPLSGSLISVGTSSPVRSGADGSYDVNAPSGKSVLQVTKEGFIPKLTNVFFDPKNGNTIETQNIILAKMPPGEPLSAGSGGVVDYQDGSAISFKPNSFVDSRGNPVSGDVDVSFKAYNPEQELDDFPGDFFGKDSEGNPTMIETFGFLFVEATKGDEKLNLGQPASVKIKTPHPNGPRSVPLWYFDELTGEWKQEGTAELECDYSGCFYVGDIAHMSSWNADQRTQTVFVQGPIVDEDGNPINCGVETTAIPSSAPDQPTDDQGPESDSGDDEQDEAFFERMRRDIDNAMGSENPLQSMIDLLGDPSSPLHRIDWGKYSKYDNLPTRDISREQFDAVRAAWNEVSKYENPFFYWDNPYDMFGRRLGLTQDEFNTAWNQNPQDIITRAFGTFEPWQQQLLAQGGLNSWADAYGRYLQSDIPRQQMLQDFQQAMYDMRYGGLSANQPWYIRYPSYAGLFLEATADLVAWRAVREEGLSNIWNSDRPWHEKLALTLGPLNFLPIGLGGTAARIGLGLWLAGVPSTLLDEKLGPGWKAAAIVLPSLGLRGTPSAGALSTGARIAEDAALTRAALGQLENLGAVRKVGNAYEIVNPTLYNQFARTIPGTGAIRETLPGARAARATKPLTPTGVGGGDFAPPPTTVNGRTIGMIADNTGHGENAVEGAMHTAAAHQRALEAARRAAASGADDFEAYVRELANQPKGTAKTAGGPIPNHPAIVATQYNPATGELRYAVAGDSRAFFIRAGGRVEEIAPAELLGASNPLRGNIWTNDMPIGSVRLNPGDTVVTFTDGIVDAVGGNNIRQVLGAMDGMPPDDISRYMLDIAKNRGASSTKAAAQSARATGQTADADLIARLGQADDMAVTAFRASDTPASVASRARGIAESMGAPQQTGSLESIGQMVRSGGNNPDNYRRAVHEFMNLDPKTARYAVPLLDGVPSSVLSEAEKLWPKSFVPTINDGRVLGQALRAEEVLRLMQAENIRTVAIPQSQQLLSDILARRGIPDSGGSARLFDSIDDGQFEIRNAARRLGIDQSNTIQMRNLEGALRELSEGLSEIQRACC